MPSQSPVRRARGQLGATVRFRGDDPAAVSEARQALKAARAEDYIKRLVEDAPPLTVEQRDRLALLLRATSGTAA